MNNTKGFTLIEIVVTLIITGIIAAVAGLWIVQTSQGFMFARQNSETLQKGQLAINRLIKEFHVLGSVSASTANSISFTSYRGGVPTNRIIAFNGSSSIVTLDDGSGAATLVDKVVVGGFDLGYYDTYDGPKKTTWTSGSSRLIGINLTLSGAGETPMPFTARVYPRNQ